MAKATQCRVEGNEAVFLIEVRVPLANVTDLAAGKRKPKNAKTVQSALKTLLKAIK